LKPEKRKLFFNGEPLSPHIEDKIRALANSDKIKCFSAIQNAGEIVFPRVFI
jgi:hypothetical protein